MDDKLKTLLSALKEYGKANDVPNVTDKMGQFLADLIRDKNPKQILEVGTANGYSTIWMADAAREVGAQIITIEHSFPSAAEAIDNFKEAGFDDLIELREGKAEELIPQLEDGSIDFAFVDGHKRAYWDYWLLLQPKLAPKAVVVFDDMIKFKAKTQVFSENIENVENIEKELLPIDEDDGCLVIYT